MGQPVTTVTDDRVKASPAFAVDDLVLGSPGMTVKLGNGPRDWGISIRGSNARNTFGVRNIVMMDDGFPVTQPDGLSRTDLIDPHAYGAVDVWRGPSSALFGDYATGGAINFRLRRGSEINGYVYGSEGGSFGYLNNYFLMGGTNRGPNNEKFEGSLFASDVRGDGYISHFSFNTQTVNSLSTYSPTPTTASRSSSSTTFCSATCRSGIRSTSFRPIRFRAGARRPSARPRDARRSPSSPMASWGANRADRAASGPRSQRPPDHRGDSLGARL